MSSFRSLDTYALRARLRPALLVVLPAAALVAGLPAGYSAGWAALWGLITYSGGTFLLAQFARDFGRRKQDALFDDWGGAPTTQRLRHCSDRNSPATVNRYHQRLEAIIPGLHLPSREEEEADPDGADQLYQSAVGYLIARTRDREVFPLVFEENCNYGFRRNYWGMKALGVSISGLTLVVAASVIAAKVLGAVNFDASLSALGAAATVSALFLYSWLFWVDEEWVRAMGFAYADRLLETCELLDRVDDQHLSSLRSAQPGATQA